VIFAKNGKWLLPEFCAARGTARKFRYIVIYGTQTPIFTPKRAEKEINFLPRFEPCFRVFA
jgi:hypothetical protein